MRALINLIHLLLCNSRHCYEITEINNRKEGVCYYYMEIEVANGDEMEDHIKWEMVTKNFMGQLDLVDEESALTFVKDSIKMSQEFKRLTQSNPHREDFIKMVLG